MNKKIVEEISISFDGEKRVYVVTHLSEDMYYGYDKNIPFNCFSILIEDQCIDKRKKAKVSKGVKDTLIRDAENQEKIENLEIKLSSLVNEVNEVNKYRNNNRKKDSDKAIQKYVETKMLSHEMTILIKQNGDRMNVLIDTLLSYAS